MTPEEKASELLQKITDTIFDSGNTVNKPVVISLAVMFVEGIIEFQKQFYLKHYSHIIDFDVAKMYSSDIVHYKQVLSILKK